MLVRVQLMDIVHIILHRTDGVQHTNVLIIIEQTTKLQSPPWY